MGGSKYYVYGGPDGKEKYENQRLCHVLSRSYTHTPRMSPFFHDGATLPHLLHERVGALIGRHPHAANVCAAMKQHCTKGEVAVVTVT